MRALLRSAIHCCPSIGLLRRVYPALVSPLCAMSSSKSADLDKSPDSWFAKFSRATETPQDCFRGFADRFNGITVDSGLEGTGDGNDFAQKLEASLQHWKVTGRRGIWFKVQLSDAAWVPALAKNGFKYHHAKDEFVMMFRWLPEHEGENIPPYAHTMIGVGAIVINERDQILAVSEKNALIPNSWKLPGGYAEPRENLADAATREVLEETKIVAKFESVVSVRHAHGAGFGCSDVYVVIAMRAETMEITKCDREIADCKWMQVDEFLTHDHVHETNRNFLRTYLRLKKLGLQIGCRDEVHPVIKRKYQVYEIIKEAGHNNSSL